MTALTPYLFFGGRCEEALAFYRDAVGAEVEMLMRFDESPEPCPSGSLPPGFEKKVMHASARIGGARLMASDGREDRVKFDGFQLALTLPTEAAARKALDGLADGGSVEMPLTPTFWSPCFGMVADKFGVTWMVMVPGQGG